jgi:leucyl/phenylalanyl-tRNA---protein transferase
MSDVESQETSPGKPNRDPGDPGDPVPVLTPGQVVQAYCAGVFPMADRRDGPLRWYSPDPRAVIPLGGPGFQVPRSLRRRIRSGCYRVTMDRAFGEVIRACAEPRAYAQETWISGPIIDVYSRLHDAGLAHSVEAWRADERAHGGDDPDTRAGGDVLVGGLYGVALGGAFFGESMFHRATDASKVCLVSLVEHLLHQGFELLDVQFVNPHLEQFGVVEIPRDEYLRRLEHALGAGDRW